MLPRCLVRGLFALACFTLVSSATGQTRIELAATPAALPEDQVLAGVVGRLEAWLDRRTPWSARADLPAIRFILPRQALQMRGLQERGHGRARGFYVADAATIYLVAPWSPENLQDRAVLLHELAHHRQVPYHFYCPAAAEEAAYRLQSDWLAERGAELDVNWLAIVLAAGCTPRDIHPD